MPLHQSGGELSAFPRGHSAWVFDGIVQFEVGATRFLAEAPTDEQLMFVVDDPVTRRWPQRLLESGRLLVASVADVYGPTRQVDAAAQLATFTSILQAAVADGYSGIRVAADNTSAIIGPERRSSWVEWERTAEKFMSENPMTGLCGFDRTRIPAADLASIVCSHTQLVDR